MIRLLLLGGNIHPNPGPQTHKWVCDICLKLIIKHLFYELYKTLGAFKRLPNNNKGLQQLTHDIVHFTALFNRRTQTNTNPLFKVLQLNSNGIHNKTNETQLLIKSTQADVTTIQETKLNKSYKTPKIPHFTPIRTNRYTRREEDKQGGLLIYIKNNISFSQFNTMPKF